MKNGLPGNFRHEEKLKYRKKLVLCPRNYLYFLAGFVLSNLMATIAIADNGNIFEKWRHEMTTNQEERQIIRLIDEKEYNKQLDAVAWSQDGKWIATAGVSLPVTIWDADTLSIRHNLDQGFRGGGLNNVTFSPDSQYLASGLSTVNMWKVADGSLHATLIAPHVTPGTPQRIGIESLRFSPDGRMLAVAYTGEKQIVIAYRIADGKIAWSYEPKRTLEPQRKGSLPLKTPLAFTPDGKRVVLGTVEYGGEDVNLRTLARILLLDAESGAFLHSIDDIHVGAPTALALSPDGQWVATGTDTGWKNQTVNRKAHQVVTVDNKDPVRIWNIETGKLVRELPVLSKVRYLTFSQDGKYLFGAKDEVNTHLTLAVWNVASGKMVQEIRNNPGPMGLAVSPDGKRLAAACQSKLSIYEIKTSN
jgi:WD40 repeat protein